jgi:glycosyltransferase involved in cell wall biosynthesis
MLGIFAYNKEYFGGTEYMGRGFEKNIIQSLPKLKKYLCAMAPGSTPSFESMYATKKPIIFWLHNTPNQFGKNEQKFLSDIRFINNLRYMIVPSESSKQEVITQTPIPAEKVYIIPNAIDPLKYNPKKFDKPNNIKLINTSSPDRGLDVLLNAISIIDLNFELDIFSKFNPMQYPNYIPDPRINFYGFSYKGTVLKHYEAAHIHAYPSTYPETFCISQAEAMSAGLLCVTSDIGAIPEVSGGYTTIYQYTEDKETHTKIFAEKLKEAIEAVKSGQWNPEAQIEYINNKFSWNAIRDKWLEFHELL